MTKLPAHLSTPAIATPGDELATIATVALDKVTGGSRTWKDSPEEKDRRADEYLS